MRLEQTLLVVDVAATPAARAGRRSRPPRHRTAGAVDMTPWIEDPGVLRRFDAKVAELGDDRCSYWLGAISSNGYGKLQLGSRSDRTAVIVAAHRFAFLRAYGVLEPGDLVRHGCDEASCVNPNPGHLIVGNTSDNTLDWLARCDEFGGPLSDPRGPGRRARAIRDAILAAGPSMSARAAAATAAATYMVGEQLAFDGTEMIRRQPA